MDVDTGVDDAYTLLLAFRCERFDVVGVTTVAGNMSVDVVTRNTLTVLDAAHAPLDVPVCKGAGNNEDRLVLLLFGSLCQSWKSKLVVHGSF